MIIHQDFCKDLVEPNRSDIDFPLMRYYAAICKGDFWSAILLQCIVYRSGNYLKSKKNAKWRDTGLVTFTRKYRELSVDCYSGRKKRGLTGTLSGLQAMGYIDCTSIPSVGVKIDLNLARVARALDSVGVQISSYGHDRVKLHEELDWTAIDRKQRDTEATPQQEPPRQDQGASSVNTSRPGLNWKNMVGELGNRLVEWAWTSDKNAAFNLCQRMARTEQKHQFGYVQDREKMNRDSDALKRIFDGVEKLLLEEKAKVVKLAEYIQERDAIESMYQQAIDETNLPFRNADPEGDFEDQIKWLCAYAMNRWENANRALCERHPVLAQRIDDLKRRIPDWIDCDSAVKTASASLEASPPLEITTPPMPTVTTKCMFLVDEVAQELIRRGWKLDRKKAVYVVLKIVVDCDSSDVGVVRQNIKEQMKGCSRRLRELKEGAACAQSIYDEIGAMFAEKTDDRQKMNGLWRELGAQNSRIRKLIAELPSWLELDLSEFQYWVTMDVSDCIVQDERTE